MDACCERFFEGGDSPRGGRVVLDDFCGDWVVFWKMEKGEKGRLLLQFRSIGSLRICISFEGNYCGYSSTLMYCRRVFEGLFQDNFLLISPVRNACRK